VLVTGPTGSGSRPRCFDERHHQRGQGLHIMTVEVRSSSPHPQGRSGESARSGEDTNSFASALKHVLRPRTPTSSWSARCATSRPSPPRSPRRRRPPRVRHPPHPGRAPVDRRTDVFRPPAQQVRVQLAASLQGSSPELNPTLVGRGPRGGGGRGAGGHAGRARRVANTRWPVSDAVSAVEDGLESRISPTRMTSGS